MAARTMREVKCAHLYALSAPASVEQDSYEYLFKLGDRILYHCDPLSPNHALLIIADLTTFKWVTIEHIEQFTHLLARRFGARVI